MSEVTLFYRVWAWAVLTWLCGNVAENGAAKGWNTGLIAVLWVAFGALASRTLLSFKKWLFAGTVINIVNDDDDGGDEEDEAETAAPQSPPTHDEFRASARRIFPDGTPEHRAVVARALSGCRCENCEPGKDAN